MNPSNPPKRHTKQTRAIRLLPDDAICEAMIVIPPILVECLVLHADACQFAKRIGGGMFCQHPHKRDIAARTAARKRAKK